ncbi:MAG: nitroreductase [Candidatus Poriferisodalaceae bacterium]|jgi:nitroreductase
MHLNLLADDVLTTTRAVRKRLDLERPVSRETLLECADIAFQAPTGSNAQGWHFMFVEDPAKKAALAELYAKNFDPYVNAPGAAYPEGDVRNERREYVKGSAVHLREHFHEVPVMFVPLMQGRVEGMNSFVQASMWGSVIPAVWSFMLAARERGLGTAWTTLHLPDEAAAAEVLGIDNTKWTQVGLFPVAYTVGTEFKKASRLDTESLVSFDTFGNR